MPHIDQDNQRVPFIVPDDANVHIDAALEQILCALDAFGAERRMHGIFGKETEFALKLLFSCAFRFLKCFSNRLVKVI